MPAPATSLPAPAAERPAPGAPPNAAFGRVLRAAADAADAAASPGGRSWWWIAPVDRGVEVRADLVRRLPATAPMARDVRLSAGAALFAMRLTVALLGFRPVTALLPDPDRPGLLAVLRRGRPGEPTPDERRLHAALGDHAPLAPPDRPPTAAALHLLRRAAEIEGAWLHAVAPGAERERTGAALPPGEDGAGLPLVVGCAHGLPAAQLTAGQAVQRVLLTARSLRLPAGLVAGPAALRAAGLAGAAARGPVPLAVVLVRSSGASGGSAYGRPA